MRAPPTPPVGGVRSCHDLHLKALSSGEGDQPWCRTPRAHEDDARSICRSWCGYVVSMAEDDGPLRVPEPMLATLRAPPQGPGFSVAPASVCGDPARRVTYTRLIPGSATPMVTTGLVIGVPTATNVGLDIVGVFSQTPDPTNARYQSDVTAVHDQHPTHRLSVSTRTVRHFTDTEVELINPPDQQYPSKPPPGGGAGLRKDRQT